MAFGYTSLLVENLEEDERNWLGYDTGSGGMLLHLRIERKATDNGPDMKTIDAEIYLAGDQVSGMGSIVWTQLKDEDLGRGMHRVVRGYQTPAGNVVIHRYSKVTFTWARTTRTFYVDEQVYSVDHATISGTDIVRTLGVGQKSFATNQLGASGATTYNSLGSWQDVLVAPAGAVMSLSVPARAGDTIDATLQVVGSNTLGIGFSIEIRLMLDAVEIGYANATANSFTGANVTLTAHAKTAGLTAGPRLLKAQIFIQTGFNTFVQSGGAQRTKLEYRLFR